MNILILDTETTGLHIENGAKVIEVAAVLYSAAHKNILQVAQTLIPCDANEAIEVNNITPELSMQVINASPMLDTIKTMAIWSSAIVAHNAEFDKKFIKSLPHLEELGGMPWICSCHDFEWPKTKSGCKLIEICVSLNVPVVSAHRALADCLLLAECFSKVDDLQGRLEKASAPKKLYKALVSYNDRQLAKDAGFVWDSLIKKEWGKRLTEEDANSLPFKVIEER